MPDRYEGAETTRDLRRVAEEKLRSEAPGVTEVVGRDFATTLHELEVHQVELELQNEELVRIQKELQNSRDSYAELYDYAPVGYFEFSRDNRIKRVNLTACAILGINRIELLNTRFTSFIAPEDIERFYFCVSNVYNKRAATTCELKLQRKNATSFHADLMIEPLAGEDSIATGYRVAIIDVSERKTAEHQTLLSGILRILNRPGDLQPLVAETLRFIKTTTGFEVVGLRLRQGEDNPYFEVNGFSDEFIREENFLCARGKNGEVLRDALGKAVLECTCGLVISGKTDPKMSCFTAGGSFWTNASHELLALPPEADPRINPRNRCIHTGYESVGLFPVIAGGKIIGLLQLNDRRPGQFNSTLVNLFEGIAQNIGLALQRATAEQALKSLNLDLEGLIEERTRDLEKAYFDLMEQLDLRTKAENSLRSLSARLLKVQEEERRSIARELHDQTGQSLTVLKMMVSRADRTAPEALKPQLKDITGMISEVLKQVRGLALSLRPGVLDELGLIPALEWLFSQLRTQAEILVHFEHDSIEKQGQDVNTAIYRITQEALTNLMRHSGVKEAWVRLEIRDGKLVLSIEDHGQGFDIAAAEARRSTGLSAMRERAILAGGSFQVKSGAGEGTLITVSFLIVTPEILP